MVSGERPRVRLRQAVLAARELGAIESALSEALGLGGPFHDPAVGVFGLCNAVFALGDCFLEVVAPREPDTAAGRHLDRHGGECGYMVIFDLEDLDGARERTRQRGVRVVWQLDAPDICGTHLHPGDTRGAIVSLDRSRPYGSWRWGGPDWTERIGTGAPGHLAGITVAVADPPATAELWGHLLGVPPAEDQALLRLHGADVRFTRVSESSAEGLCEIAVELPAVQRAGRSELKIGGVRFTLADMPICVG